MDLDTIVFVSAAKYATDKTDTTDIVALCPTGMLSIKIVESGNRHKVNIYSGFDDFARAHEWYVWVGSHSSNFGDIDHKYLKALAKAVDKWQGMVMNDCYPMTLRELMQSYNIATFAAGNEKLDAHIILAARRGTEQETLYDETSTSRAAHYEADPTYGMF